MKPTQAQIEACPFCGGPASIEEHPSSLLSGVLFSVGCDSDSEANCMGYQSLTMFNTRNEAIEAWNKRASVVKPTAPTQAQIEAALRMILEEAEEVRLATIERCARVAEQFIINWDDIANYHLQIAAAIRELKNEIQQKERGDE